MAQKKYVSLSKLSIFLDNLSNKFAALTHNHKLSDISDYSVDSALSSASTNPVQNKIIDAEFEAVSTAMSVLDLAIDSKADANHTHDDRYYTEDEVDAFLKEKADASHNHDSKYDANGSASEALVAAKEYSDTNLNTAKSYADSSDSAILEESKEYADNAVAQKSQVQIITWEDDD